MADSSERPARISRKKALWGAAITLVLLALTILGVSMFSSSADEPNGTVEVALTPAEQSSQLYDEALSAAESGDTTAAIMLLKQAVATDPENDDAAAKLSELTGDGTTGTGDPADEPTTTGDPDALYDSPVADLSTLLPLVADGYDLSQPLATESDAQVAGEGKRGGPAANVQTATFYVHDMGSSEGAKAFVANQARTAFPQDGAEVSVNEFKAYFGTDGERIAVVSFSRGRFAFEVILSARPGTPASSLSAVGVAAAQSFPSASL